jgi:hypothetical protein
MITTDLGLKLPGNDDFYDIEDFNNNFSHIENVVSALSRKIDAFATVSFVTGIMTANGAMNLGFQPSCVMVFPSNTVYGTTTSIPLHTVMALPGRPYFDDGTGNNTRLAINDNGFVTTGLFGGWTNTGIITAARPLKYIAFR